MDPNVASSSLVDRPLFHPQIMTFFQSIILGIIQGLTEFFPISSSTHLAIVENWLEIPTSQNLLYFHLSCHLGTTLSLIIYLRKKIKELFFSLEAWKIFSLALLPLLFFYPLFKKFSFLLDHVSTGYFFLLTSFLLCLANGSKKTIHQPLPKAKQALCIGFFQGLALFPGISRSGSTISCARILGLDWKSCVLFSFLLSIPTILGGEILETIHLFQTIDPLHEVNYIPIITGLISSFVVGSLILPFSFQIYEKKRILPFALYCAFLGLFFIIKNPS